MSNEWRDLPTMADVAAAQEAGDEIEYLYRGRWVAWYGATWDLYKDFRARPRPNMKTKKVRMLCFFDGCQLLWQNNNYPIRDGRWKRVPSEDKEVEVEE